MSGDYRVTRIRRDALPVGVNEMLRWASVGSRVRLTIWGVTSDAVVTELTSEWVEFRSGGEDVTP